MDGCLCVWTYLRIGRVIEMWSLKQYGVWDSWTKLFRLDVLPAEKGLCYELFGSVEAGKVLLHIDEDPELTLVDLKEDPPNYVPVVPDLHSLEVVSYVESLVSPIDT
ncbi:hypothetical protein Ancab_009093 [Ancistrocladus abbreviatus]